MEAMTPTRSRSVSVDEAPIKKEDAFDSQYVVDEKSTVEGVSGVSANTQSGAKDATTEFPDGGLRAWLVVVGGICITFSTFGFVNAWGAFQAYYERVVLPDVSSSSIAWVGSLQYALIFLPGIFTGRIFDAGWFHAPMITSTIVLLVATFVTGHCYKLWHFILCQGICIGLAAGCLFGPTIGTISHWFQRKRGIAFGVLATGSSIGGTIIPIIFRKLVPKVGFPWTMRIIGFILLGTLSFANLTMRPRLPPAKVKGDLLNLQAFKTPIYTIYTFSSLICFLGLYTPLTFIDAGATSAGIHYSFSFVAIANLSSMFGRVATGFLADKWGPMNVLIPFTALAALMIYVWPYASSLASLAVVAVIYGIASGAFVALLPSPITQMGETKDIGRRIGMQMTIMSVGALTGPPISGAIRGATHSLREMGAYAGSVVVVSVILMVIARRTAVGRWVGGKF